MRKGCAANDVADVVDVVVVVVVVANDVSSRRTKSMNATIYLYLPLDRVSQKRRFVVVVFGLRLMLLVLIVIKVSQVPAVDLNNKYKSMHFQ